MHKKLIVPIALLLFLVAAAGVASAAVPSSGSTAGKINSGGDDVHSAATIYLGQSYSFYWTWYRYGVPATYRYYTLQRSYNGGSWVTLDSDYTNGYGRTYRYTTKPLVTGTFRYRTVMNGVSSSILTLVVIPGNVRCDLNVYPRVGSKSTNFKFVGTASGATPSSYYWNFGDGKTAYGKTVYHKYAYSGYKTVKLTVKFTNGKTAWCTAYNWVRVY